jgi:hypothetical protein
MAGCWIELNAGSSLVLSRVGGHQVPGGAGAAPQADASVSVTTPAAHGSNESFDCFTFQLEAA